MNFYQQNPILATPHDCALCTNASPAPLKESKSGGKEERRIRREVHCSENLKHETMLIIILRQMKMDDDKESGKSS